MEQQIKDFLVEATGVECISIAVAPHCGYHYFEFYATEESLRKIIELKEKIDPFKGDISVTLENDKIQYRLMMSPSTAYEIWRSKCQLNPNVI